MDIGTKQFARCDDLPQELISQILLFSLPLLPYVDVFNDNPKHPLDQSQFSAQLVLGSVCKTWYHIVQSTPSLWSVLDVEFSIVRSPKTQFIIEYLRRSGNVPLYIRLSEKPPYPPRAHVAIGEVIELLNQYAARWRVLSLVTSSFDVRLLQSTFTSPPILHTFRLLHAFSPDAPIAFEPITTPNAPLFRPQRVDVHKTILSTIPFDWSALTHFAAFGFAISECLQLLQYAPRLIEATFTSVHQNSTAPTLLPFIHTSLRHLSITHFKDGQSFFDLPTIPSLTSLRLGLQNPDTRLCTIKPFIQRSGCQLESFTINDMPLRDDFLDFLSPLTSLRHLTIRHFGVGRMFLQDLDATIATSSAMLVPNLRKLEVNLPAVCHEPNHETFNTIVRLLSSSRLRRDFRSVKIKADLCRKPRAECFLSENILRSMIQIIEEGVELSIQTLQRKDFIDISRQHRGI